MECNNCTLTVPQEAMHKDGRTKNGYSSLCEACYQELLRIRNRDLKRKYRADPSKQTKDKYRAWQLKKSYGLTLEQFDEMLSEQGGVCAACGSATSRWAKGWCVDHDHSCCMAAPTCGKCTRGILCMPCNMAAGVMKDSVENLIALASYLEGR